MVHRNCTPQRYEIFTNTLHNQSRLLAPLSRDLFGKITFEKLCECYRVWYQTRR